jgi:uncharacterized protein (TIGR03437 family)
MNEGGARLDAAGGGNTAFRVTRVAGRLAVRPQETSLATTAVLNSATFTPDIATGGLISVFGSGLSRTGREARLSVGGRPATVLASFPFQVNAQVPPGTAPGSHTFRLESPWGTAEQVIEVRAVAPAPFRAGGRAILINQNGILNVPSAPASRGETVVLYVTGLGVVTGSGTLQPAVTPVDVLLRDQEMRVTYAGLSPGFPGLYQINFVISNTVAPGIDVPVTIRQGSAESRAVEISVF